MGAGEGVEKSAGYAVLAGTARLSVAMLRPHLVQRQPVMTRTRPKMSQLSGRRTYR